MAEFCKECNKELFDIDVSDFEGLCKEDEECNALCEECGPIQVNHLGKRISEKLTKQEFADWFAGKQVTIRYREKKNDNTRSI
jgi:hypothetical protein